jgi:hypothetical protein
MHAPEEFTARKADYQRCKAAVYPEELLECRVLARVEVVRIIAYIVDNNSILALPKRETFFLCAVCT